MDESTRTDKPPRKKSERRRKEKIINARVTPEFFERFQQLADKEQRDIPDLLRIAMADYMSRKLRLSKTQLRGNTVKSQPARAVTASSRAGGANASKNRVAGAATGPTSVSTTDAAPDAERETVSRRTGT